MSTRQHSFMTVLALIAGLVGGLLSSQFFEGHTAFAEKESKPGKIVQASEFRLVDEKDLVRASFGLSGGGPGIILYGKSGKFRALLSLTTSHESPVLSLADEDGDHRVTVAVKANGEPYLAMLDKDGRVRMSLTMNNIGSPALSLYDNDDKQRAMLGTANLTRVKRTGYIDKESLYALVLLNEEGNVIWQAP